MAQVTTEIESLTQRKVSGKIIGVQHASKSLSCTSCKKKVTVKSNHEVDKLASFLPAVNPHLISEEDFIFYLLDNESSFCITYETASNKLIEVSLEAI